MKTALIVGASGVVGRELIKLLSEDERYAHIIVWARRPLSFSHPKLTTQIIDFEKLSQQKLSKVDEVFCALGTTFKKAGTKENFLRVDVQYPTEIAKLAKAAGVARFILISALGANLHAKIFYSRAKGTVEQNLRNLHFPSLHIVRPSLIIGQRNDFRLGEKLFEHLFHCLPKHWLQSYRPMTGKEIAQIMIEQTQSSQLGEMVYSPQKIANNKEKNETN